MRILKKMPMHDPADRACRLCGEVTKLTFEHVPPKDVGNHARVEMLGLDAWLERDDAGTPGRGTISQRGSGAYSLCGDCNSRAGELYVPEFKKLHGTGEAALAHLDLAALNQLPEAGYVGLEARETRPARLAKQIVTMLLAISPGSFAQVNPELTAFAREPDSVGLPSGCRLYLTLFAGPHSRFVGGAMVMRRNASGNFDDIPVWELAYPPFSYVMTLDEGAPPLETGNITGWAGVGIEEVRDLDLTLKVSFGHTIYPLDFRTEATWQAQKAANRAEREIAERRSAGN